jgi:predicted dehydrogenase
VSDRKPRVGFVGLGWIGFARFKALLETELVEPLGWVEPDAEARAAASRLAPNARAFADLENLLQQQPDGVVIATPSALHAEQCIAALRHGAAVFCQKPLARNARETLAVVHAASAADRLLRVDLCYRQATALRRLREIVRAGNIGRVFAGELVFHNAYGPNKSWAFDQALAGGGCVIDLGIHLIDAALWVLGAQFENASVRRCRNGNLITVGAATIEDFAIGSLQLSGGVTTSIACSWYSSFGDHARIRVGLFGDQGGIAFENVGGSFYDFTATLHRGATREVLVEPPDDWGGRAITNWARELAESRQYVACDDLVELARAVDGLYGQSNRAALTADADWPS